MTFTTRIKDEITKIEENVLESLVVLLSYLYFNATITAHSIVILTENASVARYIFKLLKTHYNVDIKLTVRVQKKFRVKNIYILTIKDKIDIIKDDMNNTINNLANLSDEEKIAFLKGVFLATGSVNDPSKSKYHLEFLIDDEDSAKMVQKIMIGFRYNCKVIKRTKGYMVYLKASEEISDFIKMLNAFNSLFYYEDIRIYRDHKNMVNRLNNCEQANMEKVIKTCNEQVNNINYLKDNDLLNLLDEKIVMVANYRLKYPECSLNELANIVSLETDINISKSGINHYFRKIKSLVEKSKNK